MCNGKCGGCMCTPAMIGKTLVIVGGINWGLVGVGMLMGSDLNIVHMLLGSFGDGMLEAIVYVLVGAGAVMSIFACKCKKCMGTCDTTNTEGKMEGSM